MTLQNIAPESIHGPVPRPEASLPREKRHIRSFPLSRLGDLPSLKALVSSDDSRSLPPLPKFSTPSRAVYSADGLGLPPLPAWTSEAVIESETSEWMTLDSDVETEQSFSPTQYYSTNTAARDQLLQSTAKVMQKVPLATACDIVLEMAPILRNELLAKGLVPALVMHAISTKIDLAPYRRTNSQHG